MWSTKERRNNESTVEALSLAPDHSLARDLTCARERVSLEARLLPWERVGKQSGFKLSKMGVTEMGGVTMLKLAGYYLYSCTDLVRFERFSVLEITFF